jgi:hypothetical protein
MPHRVQDTRRAVIAGLDPAIHPFRETHFLKVMDTRVKPAYDAARVSYRFRSGPQTTPFLTSASISPFE